MRNVKVDVPALMALMDSIKTVFNIASYGFKRPNVKDAKLLLNISEENNEWNKMAVLLYDKRNGLVKNICEMPAEERDFLTTKHDEVTITTSEWNRMALERIEETKVKP